MQLRAGQISGSVGGGGGTSVLYVTASGNTTLTSIEVADFSADIAVTYTDGALKFIFGTPTLPSAPTLTDNSTFNTNRFNKVNDNYDISGSFSLGAYTLVSASLYSGSVLIAQTGTGTTLRTNLTNSGSQTYQLQVTASSPLDGSQNRQSVLLLGTLSKTLPDIPTITVTSNTVQLGIGSNQIEQGATGNISFTTAYGSNDQGWVRARLTSSSLSPVSVPSGATSLTISANAFYSSSGTNGSDNNPALVQQRSSNPTTYSKIISVRYGASTATSYTQAQLENLALWDTTLGGTIGTIIKGTTNPVSAGTFNLVMNGGNYGYIVVDATYILTGILNTGAFDSNDLTEFTRTVVGPYAVYRTNALKGNTIPYKLTI